MATEKRPSFQFYPKDFLADERVRLMCHTERGVYITLLSLCWLEGSLPPDLKALARLVHMPERRFHRLWVNQLSQCFKLNEEGTRLSQKRLEEEREKQDQFRRRASDGGQSALTRRGRGGRFATRVAGAEHQQGSTRVAGAEHQQGTLKQAPGSTSSSSSSSSPKKRSMAAAPPDPRVKTFIDWFVIEYATRRNGAMYVVDGGKDGAIIKGLLGSMDLENLQNCARVMLSEKCEDEFILQSDRGIGVLKVKINWLSERLAAWKARQKANT